MNKLIKAFFSDPHFGHHNIIGFCQRPFTTILHMEDELIFRYNQVIGKEDVVVWTGDCFFCAPDYAKNKIMYKLNGYKILVRGNHDSSQSRMAKMGFDLVLEEFVTNIGGKTCRVNHFPYLPDSKDKRFEGRRPQKNKGEVLIHGHTHSKKKIQGNCIHVGVDAWDYFPALFGDVENLISLI